MGTYLSLSGRVLGGIALLVSQGRKRARKALRPISFRPRVDFSLPEQPRALARGDRALLRIARALPRGHRRFPRVEARLPRLGRALPRFDARLPRGNRASPRGRRGSHAGRSLVGRTGARSPPGRRAVTPGRSRDGAGQSTIERRSSSLAPGVTPLSLGAIARQSNPRAIAPEESGRQREESGRQHEEIARHCESNAFERRQPSLAPGSTRVSSGAIARRPHSRPLDRGASGHQRRAIPSRRCPVRSQREQRAHDSPSSWDPGATASHEARGRASMRIRCGSEGPRASGGGRTRSAPRDRRSRKMRGIPHRRC